MPELKTRLTETVKAGGCASKISPAILDKVLGKLPRQHDPNVLVGFDHADDAGIYKLSADLALVQTVDFFTPIVDDPYTFGQIAATNALSDVYAMGGRPVTALAHVCFPASGDLEVLEQILAGGLSKMIEASCTVVGGHSIRDEETKFGYSVTGLIDPTRIFTNGGAQPGDRLLFTKSLGTGVISTAIKQGTAKPSWIDAATRSMTTLNKTAAEIITAFNITTAHVGAGAPPAQAAATDHVGPGLQPGQAERSSASFAATNRVGPGSEPALNAEKGPGQAAGANHVGPGLRPGQAEQRSAGLSDRSNTGPIHSLTDVTGFGLIGHAREIALASNVSLRFHINQIPLLEGALDCIRAGNIPGGLKNNRDFAECVVGYEEGIPEDLRTILFDPQTAGGLLIAVAKEDSSALVRNLKAAGVPAVEIGEVLDRTKPLITIAF